MIRSVLVTLAVATSFAGCSDIYLDQEEKGVPYTEAVEPPPNLKEVARYGWTLSRAYREAARKTTRTQDVNSALIFLAAGSFVHGAVGSASDAALANRAIAGAAVQQVGARTTPKTAILGMYTGAKRLNCIATVSLSSRSALSSDERQAATVLAYGAIEEVRILTREALVREVADYEALVTALTPQERSALRAAGEEMTKLQEFAMALQKCLEKAPEAEKPGGT